MTRILLVVQTLLLALAFRRWCKDQETRASLERRLLIFKGAMRVWKTSSMVRHSRALEAGWSDGEAREKDVHEEPPGDLAGPAAEFIERLDI